MTFKKRIADTCRKACKAMILDPKEAEISIDKWLSGQRSAMFNTEATGSIAGTVANDVNLSVASENGNVAKATL